MRSVVKSFVLSLLAVASSMAQAPVPDALTTAGTTRVDAQGRRWAWVVVNASRPEALRSRTLAVFVKPGAPDDAGSFSRVAVLAPAPDAVTVKPLLERAAALGENMALLDSVTTELWAFTRWNDDKVVDPGAPPPTPPYAGVPPLAERLAALQQRAATDPETASSLQLMAAGRPSVRQILGQGWAGLMPVAEGGTATVEVRDWNAAAQASVSVLGRVVLVAEDPLPLPPPGTPFVLPEASAKGELNIKLRWASPPELARRALTQSGFNLWRVAKTAGDALPAQPTLEELLTAGAIRVNRTSAILPKKAFTEGAPAEVTDVTNTGADGATFFFADDNDRFHGGTPFQDGEQFHYYATARDLLGRDGMVSPGVLATACRRVPPPAPRELRVENDYRYTDGAPATRLQGFRVSWQPLADDPTQSTAAGATTETHYEVVRGTDLDELNDPRLRAGLDTIDFSAPTQPVLAQAFSTRVPHATGGDITVTDYSLDAGDPRHRDTFFFAVRAVRVLKIGGTVACETPGPYSAPVMAALRDRDGPPAPTADVLTVCARALVTPDGAAMVPADGPVPVGEVLFRATCARHDESIAWAEFEYEINAGNGERFTGLLGRHFFGDGATEVSVDWQVAINPQQQNHTRRVRCRVGGYIGTVSRPAENFQEIDASTTSVNEVRFLAGELSPLNFDPAHPLAAELRTEPTARTFGPPSAENASDALFAAGTAFDVGAEVLIQVDQGGGTWRFLGVDSVKNEFPRVVRFVDGVRGSPTFTARPLRGWQMRAPDVQQGEVCVPVAVPSAPREDDPGGAAPVLIIGKLVGEAREYRIYRQVADGPLTLIKQGTGKPGSATDPDPLARTASFAMADALRLASCVPKTYFLQVFDKHGNPSPMTIIFQDLCLGAKLPQPRLSEPKPAGTDAAPAMTVEWFCEPEGVERFSFIVTSSTQLSVSLSSFTAGITLPFVGTVQSQTASKKTKLKFTSTQLTPVVGGPQFDEASTPFSRSGARFRVQVPVTAGTEYRIQVAAVGAKGETGPLSIVREFLWKPPPDFNDPAIPWPVRALPPVSLFASGAANGTVQAVAVPLSPGDFPLRRGGMADGVSGGQVVAAVRIGRQLITPQQMQPTPTGPVFNPFAGSAAAGRASFSGFLYTQAGASAPETPLPCVLYREQVANALFPQVSGDVMQVTPMIRTVREEALIYQGVPSFRLLDPHLAIQPTGNYVVDDEVTDFFLLDTQPAVSGATYRYHLLRFDPQTMEPVQTIPCGDVTIP